ncbi:MAG: hypothetical protein PHC43_00115 [Candidatus Marinimicrobia bacterium]|jgi:hypothetical protein|nr:hypothetical protein [Candidatus Neomarinimicrobiota bacterium]
MSDKVTIKNFSRKETFVWGLLGALAAAGTVSFIKWLFSNNQISSNLNINRRDDGSN